MAKGIPVIATAGCLNDPTKSTFCLATDVGQSAYLGTKALIEAMGGKGKIIHGTGNLVDPNTQMRIEAVKKAVAETNGAVTLVETLADIDDQEVGGQEDQRLPGGARQRDRRHRDVGVRPVDGVGDGAAQPG